MTNKWRTMQRRRCHRRGGTAIVEFALVIPFLAMVLLLTFSFGWAMSNQQRVWAADRYACWKQVRTGAQTTGDQLNQTFFNRRASSVSVDYLERGWPNWSDDLQSYVGEVAKVNAASGELADGLIFNRFRLGERASVQADFPTNNLFWKHFSGPIQSRHTRAGLEWRWRQARCENEVADQMLYSVDGLLATTQAPGDKLARFLRTLYRQGWQYHDWPYGYDGNMN